MISTRARDLGLISLSTVFALLAAYATMAYHHPQLLRLILAAFIAGWMAVHIAKTFKADQAGAARFQTLAEAIPQIVWIADAKGYTTYINKRWYEMTGTREGNGLGSGWIESVHPDDRIPCQQKWETCALR